MEQSRIVDHLWTYIRNDVCVRLQDRCFVMVRTGEPEPVWDGIWTEVQEPIDRGPVSTVRADVWRNTRSIIYEVLE